ncbi:MAG TPA: asparagine synthase (glutamine-hydrolyzing) [Longimicrobiaceae bacterium]|nr:asparagine synthase (glutamine-hydrolyzing) [Longimicrobiaceae bacterium]
MCGIAGYVDTRHERPAEREVLARMAGVLTHRGPDSDGCFVDGSMGLGFRRLSIIGLEDGQQPLYNEDRSLVLICNGEIFNYRELREELVGRGHVFRTHSDTEVLLHLYEDHSTRLLEKLNGQFAFALYDRKRRRLFMARDPFGVAPLFYTVADGTLIFASEVKAILQHPLAPRGVDLTGLDQVLSLPGVVSPRTMFRDVRSLAPGHYLVAEDGALRTAEYWDLDYPLAADAPSPRPEEYYVEALRDRLRRSVEYRLRADVPVGVYLSGGLDSSLIAALAREVAGEGMKSFAIGFTERRICESSHQRVLARHVGADLQEILFDWSAISGRLSRAVYHSECALKETYNTCSLALSEAARSAGVPVVLSGEGSDELFAGYVGYRFDQYGVREGGDAGLDELLEEEMRERVWGDAALRYETDFNALRELKSVLYSRELAAGLDDFDCFNFDLVNRDRIRGRHPLHQRSYLDFKLRLADHLVSDHGDRMALANAVEGRYPFLDLGVVELAREIPAGLKLNGLNEKYVVKRAAEGLVPMEIIQREKYSFHAPGSPYLLRQGVEWINDLLSYDRIRRQGYFNPDTVERLRRQYLQDGFRLNLPFETDLLAVVLTFGIWLDRFEMSSLN